MISIIIPTFNRIELLSRCLDHLSPQNQIPITLPYEVIITDDSPNTVTKNLVDKSYPWVKWVEGPRKGPAANRNNGVTHAIGEWIVFTDDDCLPEPGWLAAYCNAICSNPSIQVFEGKTICKTGLKTPLDTAPINENGGFLWSCNFAITKKLFLELGGFNTDFPFAHMEDVDLREKILKVNHLFVFVPLAIIDHPPRKMSSGKNLARQHESEFFYYRRIKRINTNLNKKLVIDTLRFRIKNILSYRFSIDTISAVYSMVVEVIYTISFLSKWNKKYPKI